MERLPTEVGAEIFSYLPIKSHPNVLRTNKSMHEEVHRNLGI